MPFSCETIVIARDENHLRLNDLAVWTKENGPQILIQCGCSESEAEDEKYLAIFRDFLQTTVRKAIIATYLQELLIKCIKDSRT